MANELADALLGRVPAEPTTADVLARMPTGWGGIKSYIPEEWRNSLEAGRVAVRDAIPQSLLLALAGIRGAPAPSAAMRSSAPSVASAVESELKEWLSPRAQLDMALGELGLPNQPRRAGEEWALSRNTPRYGIGNTKGKDQFGYTLFNKDEPVGYVHGHLEGQAPNYDSANIHYIEAPAGQNTLGPNAMRAFREAFREDYPSVTRFYGDRISGARVNGPATANKLREATPQSVTMPAIAGGITLADILKGNQNEQ